MKKIRLVAWIIYGLVYFVLLLIGKLPFTFFLAILFLIQLVALLIGFNLWGIRMIFYTGIIITTFLSESKASANDSILSALIFFVVLGWGLLGAIIEFFASNPSQEEVDKTVQIGFGICPYCWKKINITATKCPYCTKDLPYKKNNF